MAGNTVVVSITSNIKGLQKGLTGAQSALGKLGGVAATAAKVVAGVGLALGGLALAGGIARAVGLDEANTKFKALGYSADEVTNIMDSALKSVKGTAFGLNDAATVAAGALAAGIKPGDQLTRVLTTVGNTAALAGSDMGEMGAIFNKISANTKVTTAEMNQLADRGVPVWQYLADSIGTTVPELRKMIEAGEVSSDMFLNAMEPAVAGVADTMGKSFMGSVKNAQAALSRFGAAFVAPTLPILTSLLGEFMVFVDGLTEMLKPAAEAFGEWLGTLNTEGIGQGVLDFINTVIAGLPDFIRFISTVSPLSILFKALAPLADELSEAFDAIVGVVIALMPQITSLAETLGGAALVAATVLAKLLVDVLVPALTNLADFIAENVDWLVPLAVGIGAAVLAFKAWGAAILIWSGIKKAAIAVQAAFNAVMNANPITIIVLAIVALVAALIYFFTQTELGKEIWANFTQFLEEAWTNIVTFITEALTNITTFFNETWTNISDFFTTIWTSIVEFFTVTLTGIIDTIIQWGEDVWTNISDAWNKVMTFFGELPGKIWQFFVDAGEWLLKAGKDIIEGMRKGIEDIWTNVSTWFQDLPNVIGGWVSGAGDWLLDTGEDLIQGLVDGIGNAAQWIKDKIGEVINGAIDWAKDLLGIASPSKVFKGIGKNVGQGLADGLDASKNVVVGAMDTLSDLVTDGFSGTLSAPELAMAVSGSGSLGSAGVAPVYNVTVSTLNANAETGRVIIESIRDYETAGGRQ